MRLSKKNITLIVSFVFIAIVIAVIVPSVHLANAGSRVVQHGGIYRELNRYYSENQYPPKQLQELSLDGWKSPKVINKIKYNPENWKRKDSIVLESYLWNHKIFTYSDGKTTRLYKDRTN